MLSSAAFEAVADLFHSVSGIRLVEAKAPLVSSRLQKLAQAQGISDLDEYVDHMLRDSDPDELVRLVDKLTTNETYFFREPEHFHFLAEYTATRASQADLRVWSAASSSGEEAYSIAMLLAEQHGLRGWEIVGTDLSTAMVAHARRALYPLERARDTPEAFLKRWCLKGERDYAGQLLIKRELREQVHFQCANLMQTLPDIGMFDVIFLRNVLIYFDNPAKAQIVRRVLGRLKPDGFLFTGHAESIASLGLPIRTVASAVYRHG